MSSELPESPSIASKNNQELRSTLQLLARKPSESYTDSWTTLISTSELEKNAEGIPVLIFRLGGEKFAIPATRFSEILEERKIHSIPGRNPSKILGVVNFHGRLTTCVNFGSFLGLNGAHGLSATRMMLAIKEKHDIWIFPVDEVYGVFKFAEKEIRNIPANVEKSASNLLRGIFQWENGDVGLLDSDLVMYGLKRFIK